jgi:general secretion pathway protein D
LELRPAGSAHASRYKEIVLNITNRFLLCAVATGALCSAHSALAQSGGVAVLTAISVSGQSAKGGADPRREAQSLLAQSRKAMAEGDWNAAEALLKQAELMNADFGRLSFGDTPAKARKDLERRRPAAAKRATAAKQAPTTDPFAAHQEAAPSRAPQGTAGPNASRSAPASAALAARRPQPSEPTEQEKRLVEEAIRKTRAMSGQNVIPLEDPANQRPVARSLPTAPSRPRAGATLDAQPMPINRTTTAVANRPVDQTPMGAATDMPPMPPAANFEQAPAAEPRRLALDAPAPQSPQAPAGGVEQVTHFTAETQNAAVNPVRQQSDQLLVAARKSLAVGDVARAARLTDQAKALGVKYGIHDDSPARLSATIAKQVELSSQKGNKDANGFQRRQVELLMEQADAMIAWKEFGEAERLATDAKRMPVSYGPFDAKPDDLLNRVAAARKKAGRFRDDNVIPAAAEAPLADTVPAIGVELPTASMIQQSAAEVPVAPVAATPDMPAAQQPVARSEIVVQSNRYQDVPATGAVAPPDQVAQQNAAPAAAPQDLFTIPSDVAKGPQPPKGDAKLPVPAQYESTGVDESSPLKAQEPVSPGLTERAPVDRAPIERLPIERIPAPLDAHSGSLLGKATAEQTVLARKAAAEFMERQSEAKRIQQSDPKQALVILQEARAGLAKSKLEPTQRDQLLRAADRKIIDMENYIAANIARIELKEKNTKVKDEIARDEEVKVEVQEKLAFLVNDFNKLMDEERYAEAEVFAKKAQELAPHEQIVTQLGLQAKMARRLQVVKQQQSDKETGFLLAMDSIERAAIPGDDYDVIQYPKNWGDYQKSEFRKKKEGKVRRSEKELEIERGLKTPVLLKFQSAPLSEVIDHLEKLTMVNMHLDSRGLASEGLTDDTQVTINLSAPITLKSALNLILEPLHLSYVIKNEVLNITSEQMRDGEIITVTYSVADLIVPIPNFTPNGQWGLAGALADAQNNARSGSVGFASASPLTALASNSGPSTANAVDPRVMAQIPGMSGGGPSAMVDTTRGGPGGLGGGASADFDSLIQLLTSTVGPDTWEENGGPGAIQKYPNNLSLVVSNTLQVHEQIADLLDQLRRLHDLQVTIEVRFITLNDNFFERIGVDFDFRLEDYTPASIVGPPSLNQAAAFTATDPQLGGPNSVTVGLQAPGVFSADLDVPFNQDSFTGAIPQFGFVPNVGATMGFAILSDIEAFFFIEASQGDRRSNVLQAPKVTLFNGQQAIINDTSQTPFVVSVVPVVGDFAAALQPVVVVLSEGTMLTVQAVVSEDRRYVRMTLVPYFSSIGAVNTFTFTGSASSTTTSASTGTTDNTTGRANQTVTSREGTTVQLPTLSQVSVSTTVSVPDGGTVLLGGVKRLSEGRNEFGVPILSKLPYINRLFRNVGIGRTTQSLMMMVTPRIIIQEEEEFNLTGQNPPGS